MKAAAIENELKALEARQVELDAQRQEAETALAGARQELVSGNATIEHVSLAQTIYTALSETIASVTAQLSALRERWRAARAQEQAEKDSQRVAELREQRQQLALENETIRAEVNAYLAGQATRLLSLRRSFYQAGREIDSLVPPTGHSRGVAHHAIRMQELEHGEAIELAVRIVTRQEERAAKKAA
jgi:chromosome segregation ATPase